MERRKILLGSGVALTTALAGCFGSETSDDDGTGSDNGNDDGYDDNGNDDGYDDNGDRPDSKFDDIPGYDGKKLDLDSDLMALESIKRKGGTISIVAWIGTTDREKLYDELKSIVENHEKAMVNVKKFKHEIDKLNWTIEHDGEKVAAFTVKVSWIVDLYEGTISKEEFKKKVEDQMK